MKTILITLIFVLQVFTMHNIRNVQSGYTEADFWEQWSSTTPRMTLCIKITPQSFWTDVAPIGLTSNSRDMVLPAHSGITFKAKPAITPSVIEQGLGEATNLEMTGIYQDDSFTYEDVIAGKWRFATVEVFSVCWDNPNLGEFLHSKSRLAEFKDYQRFFTAESRGLIAQLSNDVDLVTQRRCRVKNFRDAQCKHTASTVTIGGTAYNIIQTGVTGSPASTVNTLIFDTTSWAGNNPPPDSLFANGKITCKSGKNKGVSREIAAVREATGGYPFIAVYLKRAFPFEITSSQTFDFVAGCTQTLEDCRKYENAINFRAEAFVPGLESANRIPPGT